MTSGVFYLVTSLKPDFNSYARIHQCYGSRHILYQTLQINWRHCCRTPKSSHSCDMQKANPWDLGSLSKEPGSYCLAAGFPEQSGLRGVRSAHVQAPGWAEEFMSFFWLVSDAVLFEGICDGQVRWVAVDPEVICNSSKPNWPSKLYLLWRTPWVTWLSQLALQSSTLSSKWIPFW